MLRLLFALVALVAALGPAAAHFAEGVKVRTVIVAVEDGRLKAYVRTPAPLHFAGHIVEAAATGQPFSSQFLRPDGPLLYLSREALAQQREAFEALVAAALDFSQNGLPLDVAVVRLAISAERDALAFNTRAEAEAALEAPRGERDPTFGEALIDVELSVAAPDPHGTLVLRSALPPLTVQGEVSIENHVVDARGDPAINLAAPGQLQEPVTLDGSWLSAVGSFLWQGIVHILEGPDHVLLVVCLALGVGAALHLLWLVSAFTIGHSITLIATFLGTTPEASWFVPLVEAAIAASVVYAAVAALLKRVGSVVVMAAIGLLHGLGFSFVLSEILGPASPNLVSALLAFNLGIEIGQVAILVATLLVLAVLRRISASVVAPIRAVSLAGIALVAAVWVVERVGGLV